MGSAGLALMFMAAPAWSDPLGGAAHDTISDTERLQPGVYPAAPVPEAFAVPSEPGHPPFEIDWSVGLRGSLTKTTAGDSFTTSLTPQFSATHAAGPTDIVFSGQSEIAKPGGDNAPEVTGLALSLSGALPLDGETNLSGALGLGFSQDPSGAPNTQPQVTRAPALTTGTLEMGIARQFGRFTVGLDVGGARTVYGPSTRLDTGVTDNSRQNHWTGTGSLRVGYQLTPIFEVFSQADMARDLFDRPDSAGIFANATNRSLRAGISGAWGDTLQASLSSGFGQRDFDAGVLSDVDTYLYGASLTFTPDPTWQITAGLETKLTPAGPDTDGTARIEHAALADIGYTVNSWLRLRASADWSHAEFAGSDATQKRFGLGTGADYTLNAHTVLSADYAFDRRTRTTTTDSHQVNLGIRVSR